MTMLKRKYPSRVTTNLLYGRVTPKVLQAVRHNTDETEMLSHMFKSFRIGAYVTKYGVRKHATNKYGFRLQSKYDLLPHQYTAIDWVLRQEKSPHHNVRGGILSLQMGMGKTLIALSLARISVEHGATLIVCTKSVLDAVRDDLRKFFNRSELRRYILYGKVALDDFERTGESSLRKATVVVTTYDVVTQYYRKKGAKHPLFQINWYRVIADESQRFSNPKTKISDAMKSFPPGCRVCLTGTPIKNYDYELFNQLLFCGLNTNGRAFTYQTYTDLKIHQCVLVMTMADANIRLPDKHDHDEWLVLPPKEKAVYDHILQCTKQQYAQYRAKTAKWMDILGMITRLRQACACAHVIYEYLPSALQLPTDYTTVKFQRTKEIFETKVPKGEKLIVFSGFKGVLKHLSTTWSVPHVLVHGETKDRADQFHEFRSSDTTNVLLLTSQVGSVGLNLQEANHIILLDPWWNFVQSDQAEARCHRIGQKREVHIWRLYIKNSIEQRMLDMCQSKSGLADQFLTPELLSVLL